MLSRLVAIYDMRIWSTVLSTSCFDFIVGCCLRILPRIASYRMAFGDESSMLSPHGITPWLNAFLLLCSSCRRRKVQWRQWPWCVSSPGAWERWWQIRSTAADAGRGTNLWSRKRQWQLWRTGSTTGNHCCFLNNLMIQCSACHIDLVRLSARLDLFL